MKSERQTHRAPKFDIDDVLYEAQAIIKRSSERSSYDFYGISWDPKDRVLSTELQDTLPNIDDVEIEIEMVLCNPNIGYGRLAQALASIEQKEQRRFCSRYDQILDLLTDNLELPIVYLEHGPTPIPHILEHADATLTGTTIKINWTHNDPVNLVIHYDIFNIDENGFASHERQTFQANKNMAKGSLLKTEFEKFGDTAENVDLLANRFSSLCKALKKASKRHKISLMTQKSDGYSQK